MIRNWKDIEGFEGIYQISDYGEVKSLRRAKLLKGKEDKDGYIEYCLCLNNNRTYRRAHRLVAEAFVPNTEKLPIINHKDLNKKNNHWKNLEWCSNFHNIVHFYKNSPERRIGRGLSDLSESDLLEMVSLYKSGKDYTYLQEYFNLSVRRDVIGEVLSGRRYSEVTGIKKDIRRKHNHSGTKLSDDQVFLMYDMYFKDNRTQTELCSIFNMSPPQVHRIVKGTRRSDLFDKYIKEGICQRH